MSVVIFVFWMMSVVKLDSVLCCGCYFVIEMVLSVVFRLSRVLNSLIVWVFYFLLCVCRVRLMLMVGLIVRFRLDRVSMRV